MCEIILITSGKGGVGKSTVASTLALKLAKRKVKTLLIDGDAAMGADDIMLSVSDKKVYTWADFNQNECAIDDCVIKLNDFLGLIPAPNHYPTNAETYDFGRIIELSRDEYDYILIDSPAGVEFGMTSCAVVATRALIVSTADEIAVRGAAETGRELEKLGIDNDHTRLLINRFVKKAAIKSQLLKVDGAIDKSGIMLLGILPETEVLTYSSVTGQLPKKKSKFDKALERVCDRVLGKNVPLPIKKL